MLLRDRREQVLDVLEVGIGSPGAMPHIKGYKAGASLRMWRDYFPNSMITGLDIDENAVSEANDLPRIWTHWCKGTQYSSTAKFNLIVDDGSHSPEDQVDTFNALKSLLAKDGLYIIEDVERYALEQNLLSPHLPEHTVIQHHHGKEVGRCILIRG